MAKFYYCKKCGAKQIKKFPVDMIHKGKRYPYAYMCKNLDGVLDTLRDAGDIIEALWEEK